MGNTPQFEEPDNFKTSINEDTSEKSGVQVTNLIDLNDKGSNSLVADNLKNETEKKNIPKTSSIAITSKIGVSTTFQPIWKVCTFPVRSYVQHKEALRGGCEIECKSRGGKPEILVAFRVQGWKLPRS